jgi:4-amino-4-deoxy-L-arabinose transferase-like glycosyltransferase
VRDLRAGRALLVAALLIAALGIRVAQVERSPYRAINDAGTYNRLASEIATTGDYDTGTGPGSGAGGSRGPTAYFPPGYPYFLAAVDLLDGHEAGGKTAVKPERLAGAALGTAAVALIDLVALEAFGPMVALVSLALAAFYPVLIELSGTLVAENLLVVLELAAVWTVLRARRAAHRWPWIAAGGVLTGLATLTHQNGVLLLIPLAVGAWTLRPRWSVRALAAPVLLIATALVTIAPWTIRNSVELHRLIPVSDESGITLVGTYNPTSAAFRPVPYKWRLFWGIPQDAQLMREAGRFTEPELGDRLQSQALHYIGAHPLAPLKVAYHNTLRLFELEGSYAWHASAQAVSLQPGVAQVGVIGFWILCALALLGALSTLARRAPRWLWGVPVLLALSVVFVNVETPRFRAPIDPFLILLAGCALATVLTRATGHFATTSGDEGARPGSPPRRGTRRHHSGAATPGREGA